MDRKLREAQNKILEAFSRQPGGFALAGGTALELYYLHHRFSADLDFFSSAYDTKEIENLVFSFEKHTGKKLKLEAEFFASQKARVRFYTAPVEGSARPLKIDFIEDVLFAKPEIKKINGVPVYSVKNIYIQKISAITGVPWGVDEMGRELMGGRKEARDIFDIYMLSKEVSPLHIFIKQMPHYLQRGMIHWYRTFSRQDIQLSLLDLDIYDKKFDSKKMIIYLENEIKKFIGEVIE